MGLRQEKLVNEENLENNQDKVLYFTHQQHVNRRMALRLVKNQSHSEALSRVLLVEDDAISRTAMAKFLQHCGVDCDTVADGRAAVQACIDSHYPLIFMDCQLPELDGFKATHQIRALEKYRDGRATIIATTAVGDEPRCTDAGMDGFLQKPIFLKDLREIVQKYL